MNNNFFAPNIDKSTNQQKSKEFHWRGLTPPPIKVPKIRKCWHTTVLHWYMQCKLAIHSHECDVCFICLPFLGTQTRNFNSTMSFKRSQKISVCVIWVLHTKLFQKILPTYSQSIHVIILNVRLDTIKYSTIWHWRSLTRYLE